jgi:RNase P subunit RPR2
MTKAPYVLSAKYSRRFQARGIALICRRCGQPIISGQEIVNRSQGARSRRLYHAACYDAMFVDIPDEENEEEKHEHEISQEETQKTT